MAVGDPERGGWRGLRLPSLDQTPLELRLVGRTLLHAALVGATAGIIGVVFFRALELAQYWALERAAGFEPLRALGEGAPVPGAEPHRVFRPWLLWVIPALGAFVGGIVSVRFAPETQGGGGDAMIEAFHTTGTMRRRVPIVKAIASIFTLGAGGSGGREGPTMQIGAAIGSIIGRYLKVDVRERRILLVAGCAAGMAAVFRTPLGAALLAVEVLYRDDFESDALIPALLASVVSYSVFVSVYGESTLFAHAPHYAFVTWHLPLYALMALVIAAVAVGFLSSLRAVQALTGSSTAPKWLRPAIGGLMVGIIAAVAITVLGPLFGMPGQGFGMLGGGYGIAQVSIIGAPWLPTGWRAVELLVALLVVKIIVTSFTVGTGGSAGDFGPSLVMGGLVGGAFGRAAQLLFHDPRIDPGAFALVGMGTFYGGVAHVPISSLVMTCELAGSYDLLVPLMLAEGVAFVALRRRSLYHAQVGTKRDSEAHSHELIADVLETKQVCDVMIHDRAYLHFSLRTPLRHILERVAENDWQDAFPVLDDSGTMIGLIDMATLRGVGADHDVEAFAVAADVMGAPVSVRLHADLHEAAAEMARTGFRELPVLDDSGAIVGFLDETDVTRVYLEITGAAK